MLRSPADIYRTGGNAMDKEKFKGIFPALLTPFDSDGNVNTDSIEKLMGYCMEHGVRGFYICGSSAEVFLLEKEEREEIYRKCAKFGAGKTTLISHVGDMSVKRAVEYAKLCESLGYDAVSAVTPFYFKYTDRQIIDYYKTLAAFMRENSGLGYSCKKAISYDFGTTWEGVYDTNIDCCHRPVVDFYDNDKILMTYRYMQGGEAPLQYSRTSK